MPTRCRPDVLAFIGLGANLGSAQAMVLAAMNRVGALPDTRLLQASSLYRTQPVEAQGPDFFNAVIGVLTKLGVHELLFELQQIENQAGRERPYRNAPRTLDLDILLYGDAQVTSATLQVPHPRMNERAFVLVPLAEIAPAKVSQAQLQAVSRQVISRVPAQ